MSRRVISRPNYRFSMHSERFHIPVGTRRGVGAPAQHFYRESFMDELAHAAGKDPYRYRRDLVSRTNLPYKDDILKALDMAAEMSGWGKPLPKGTVRAIAFEERGAEEGHHATLSAMVHTISSARTATVRVERVDVAHDEGFGSSIRSP
jgi:isoquinoline 1-oxidoreductase beta subunit